MAQSYACELIGVTEYGQVQLFCTDGYCAKYKARVDSESTKLVGLLPDTRPTPAANRKRLATAGVAVTVGKIKNKRRRITSAYKQVMK